MSLKHRNTRTHTADSDSDSNSNSNNTGSQTSNTISKNGVTKKITANRYQHISDTQNVTSINVNSLLSTQHTTYSYPSSYSTHNISIYESYNISKRNGEIFFLLWSIVWILLMAYIVISGIYHRFTAYSYMYVGLFISIPPIVIPILYPSYCDNINLSLYQRYTTKANIYIFVLSYIGNYLWTHYFYTILHTSYTFPSIPFTINEVPIACILITHGYFHLYHTISNIILRIYWRIVGENNNKKILNILYVSLLIFLFSYITAFMEAYTIQKFEYYVIPDRYSMYLYGSVFYAIYFWISFPMFYRLDERPNEIWSIEKTIIDVFSCCMIVTMILDMWRLIIGDLSYISGNTYLNTISTSIKHTLPWLTK